MPTLEKILKDMGRRNGIRVGERRGLKKGREEGREEGRAELRRVFITMLSARFGAPTPRELAVLQAADLTTLATWMSKVRTATSTRSLLGLTRARKASRSAARA